ncbi:hypothetical protein K504DRAFT_459617 [Pleomassaria siparia CBS 279.74]|uniref:Histone acetyltransferase n=1 Tax=Pleomassaria siparia CBS 279.74 TaxID=1314801 RepID=A0A6G1K1Q6_9PLEO|nr:hypothetical protein K504DRAFT_459617 [Pleomassaria siparia CBS 279.74]
MAEPARLLAPVVNNDAEDLDADGEYEEDDIAYDHIAGENTPNDNHTDVEGSDVDAEGEEVDDDDEGEPVGAVKMAGPADTSDEEDDDHHDEDAADSFSDVKTSGSEISDPSSDESEADEKWRAESEDGEEPAAERTDPNECVYCGQDEENDPSPEFEMYLSCAVCGDNAHRQCARDASTLGSDDDTNRWRCTACIQNNLEDDEEDDEEDLHESVTRQRLSSVPKLARDLLPSHRGADPGGHSIFNDLILPDDPVDGSRSLRKRKSSQEEEVLPVRQSRKKRRSSELSKSAAGGNISPAATSPRAQEDENVLVSENESETGQHTASEQGSSRVRSTRSRRAAPQRKDKRPLVWIEESQGLSLIIAFHLNNEKVQKIVTVKPKKRTLTAEQERQERRRERDRERRERNRRLAQQNRAGSPAVAQYPAAPTTHAAPFYAFPDKDMDENKSKPYGGILSEADADTSKTYPAQVDRKRFDDARLQAEEEWKQKQQAMYGGQESKPIKQAGPPSKIKCINFGGWEIDTWHAAPYPEEYSKNKVLYICEFCLKYMNSDYVAWRHKLKCPAKHPPGDEIYRDGEHSFFEVDGRKNPVYCQNLCLLAKLFLGSKTLYYDVEPFLFYVMTVNNDHGCHFVGYFSKEKRPSSQNNVSCILVLPIYMRKGYGQFLIEFSYLLTRVEKKTGSPEKPLSDMGLVSYRKYWRLLLCEELLKQKGPISITTISERTGMTPDDIVSALEGLRALVRDPVTKTYAFRLDYGFFKQYIEKCSIANNPKIKPEKLIWTPYVMGRFGQYEDGPALHNVQPREAEDEDQPAPEEGVQMEMAAKQTDTSNNNSTTGGDDARPFTPARPVEDSMNGDSPAPGTPLANGSTAAVAGSQLSGPLIPPSRYEVFPHIPGMPTAKRRPGRPFGSRRRTSTPQRNRNTPLSIATAPVSRLQLPSRSHSGKTSPSANGALTPGTISGRRTRSKLGESVFNGTNGTEDDEGGAVKSTNGRSSGTQSHTGSPRQSRSSKGKGTLLRALEDDIEDEDLDAEGEVDEIGDMDIDAEGEEDDDVVMANA